MRRRDDEGRDSDRWRLRLPPVQVAAAVVYPYFKCARDAARQTGASQVRCERQIGKAGELAVNGLTEGGQWYVDRSLYCTCTVQYGGTALGEC